MDSGWRRSTNPLALQCVICLLLHFTASPIFFFESNKYKCVQCSQFFSSKKPPIYFQLSELFVKDYLDLYVLTFAHKLVSPLCTHFMQVYMQIQKRRYICCTYKIRDEAYWNTQVEGLVFDKFQYFYIFLFWPLLLGSSGNFNQYFFTIDFIGPRLPVLIKKRPPKVLEALKFVEKLCLILGM